LLSKIFYQPSIKELPFVQKELFAEFFLLYRNFTTVNVKKYLFFSAKNPKYLLKPDLSMQIFGENRIKIDQESEFDLRMSDKPDFFQVK